MSTDPAIVKLTDLLLTVQAKITDRSDVVWTRYDSPAQMRNDIGVFNSKLAQEDLSVIGEMVIFFAAAGSLQEHSISNGWGDEFLEIARHFDDLCKRINIIHC